MENTIKETTRLLLQGTLTKDEADKILFDLHSVSNSEEELCDFCNKNEATNLICDHCLDKERRQGA